MNVLDFLAAPIESDKAVKSVPTSTPKLSTGIPSLLSGNVFGMANSTPAIAAPGTPNITPLSVGKSILQGAARAPLQAGTSVGQIITEALGIPTKSTSIPSPNKTIFGEAPIDTIQGEHAKMIAQSKAAGTPSYIYKPLAGLATLGTIAADFTPPIFPEGGIQQAIKDGTIPEQFFKTMAKETSETTINGLLRQSNLPEEFIQELAPAFAKTKSAQEAKNVLIDFTERYAQPKITGTAPKTSGVSDFLSKDIGEIVKPGEVPITGIGGVQEVASDINALPITNIQKNALQAIRGGHVTDDIIATAKTIPQEVFDNANPDIQKLSTGKGTFNLPADQAEGVFRKFFDPNEVSFMVSKTLPADTLGVTNIGRDIFSDEFRTMVKVATSGGKVSEHTIYHEAFHAFFNNFVDPTEADNVLNKVQKSKLAIAQKFYDSKSYSDPAARAEEWLADDFASYMKGPGQYKGIFRQLWEKLLNKLRDLIRRSTGAQKVYEDMVARNRPGKVIDTTLSRFEKVPEQPKLPLELQQRKNEIDLKAQTLAESPFKSAENKLMVDREGRVRELGDMKNPALIKKIEDRMAEIGVKDPAEFSAGVEKYFKQKAELKAMQEMFNADKKSFLEGTPIRQMSRSREIPSLEALAQQFNGHIEEPLMQLDKTIKAGEIPAQDALPANTKKVLQNQLSQGPRTPSKELSEDYIKNIGGGGESLPTIISRDIPDGAGRVHIFDYLRTPENVLKKLGLTAQSKLIRKQYEGYLKELPQNINKITAWSKQVPAASNAKIFDFLDGKNVVLDPKEMSVAKEIESWLSQWADRLDLPKDNRISNYITHIFEKGVINKEFDADIAKIIENQIPGSVYDPFLLKRKGAPQYVRDTWRALDAYVKRATRKVYMDPALSELKKAAKDLDPTSWKYIKRYADNINMRPSELDQLIDGFIKQAFGYKFGLRPLNSITRTLRQATYRGTLGLNFGAAVRNLTQGVNTYATLGEKYTALGYMKLLQNGTAELTENGVLGEDIVQDRVLSATKKTLEKVDKGLFYFFETAEKINRGSAYFGAKAKALDMGKSEKEAVEYAKDIVRKTQFAFSSIDTPVALQGDLAKTLIQLQTFTVKQMEFLGEKIKDKDFAGLIRYVIGSFVVLLTIGKLLNMKPKDMIPTARFALPPTLQLPGAIIKAMFSNTDQYGSPVTLAQKAQNIVTTAIPYIPAGAQAKKTYQGIKAVKEGGDYTATGKTRFNTPTTTGNYIKAGLFGKSALPEAQAYYDKVAGNSSTPKKAQTILDKYKVGATKSSTDILKKYNIKSSASSPADIMKKYNLK